MGAIKYTEEDIELLRNYYGTQSIGWLQCRLSKPNGKKRTKDAIRRKASSIGCLGYRENRDRLTASQLAECMGVHRTQIHNQWMKMGLKVFRKGLTKNMFIEVDPIDWWRFAEKNKEKIDFSRYKEGSILPEPNWVKEEIRNPKYRKREWTRYELERLKILKNKGIACEKIAKELNKTEKAVRKKLYIMYKNGEVKKKNISLKYTEKEIEMILEMRRKGLSYKEIAHETGRDKGSVYKKIRKIENQNK